MNKKKLIRMYCEACEGVTDYFERPGSNVTPRCPVCLDELYSFNSRLPKWQIPNAEDLEPIGKPLFR